MISRMRIGRDVERARHGLLPRWVRGYRRAWLRTDVVAGLVVAVTLVPQVMAYAAIAGMPPVTGLYAALAGLVAYALFGSSSHLHVGPVATVALLSAAALGTLAPGGGQAYVAFAGVLAVCVGALHVLLRVARFAWVVSLLSQPVITGYIAAAGLIIGVNQVSDLLGLGARRPTGFTAALAEVVRHLPDVHPVTATIGLVSLALLLAGRRFLPRVPWPLAVAAVATALTALLGLAGRGVAVVGDVPAGLPRVSIELPPFETLGTVALLALPIAVIAYAESIAIAKAAAARTRERLDPGRELVAYGSANAASGLLGGFPISGSFTRTAINLDAGARSQLSGVVAAGVVALVLLVLTGAFFHLPQAVLAAIVLVAVKGLVDVRAARQTWRVSRREGAALATTLAGTLVLGVQVGLAVGLAANLLLYVHRRTRPHLVELGRVLGTRTYRDAARYPTVRDPDIVLVRLGAALEFLNVNDVLARLLALAADRPELRAIVLDGSSLNAVDVTGIVTLEALAADLDEAGVGLHIATVRGPVHAAMVRAGVWPALAHRCHPDIAGALSAAGVPDDAPIRAPSPDECTPAGFV